MRLDAFRARLARPTDPASLVAFRVLFGVLMAANVVRYELEGWVDQLYVAPEIHFPYWGFSWVQALPAAAMHGVFAVVAASALFFAAGAFTRVALSVFLVAFTYIELIDRTTYLNHYYLVTLLAALMWFMPMGAFASVDAWRRRRARPELAVPRCMPAWPLWVLRGQLGLVYVFAGLAKLHGDWLLRAEPLATWLARYADLPLVGPFMDDHWLASTMSWAGMIFDLTVPAWLLWTPSRRYAYAAVVGFHLVTAALFPIGIFPFVMIAATTVFFAPDWPRALHRKLRRAAPEPRGPRTPAIRPSGGPTTGPRSNAALVAFGVYFLVQLVLPLRQHLYGGERCWHEQGYRFAWNVMLMEKTGQVDFRVRDREGETIFHPREVLTPLQMRMMQTQPDLILSFAHYLRDRWVAEGRGTPEVRADAWASLNGRPRQRLVDPDVDLASIRDGFGPKRWILPLDGARRATVAHR